MSRREPSDGEAVDPSDEADPPERGIWEAIADALIGAHMGTPPLINWSGLCYDPVDEAEQILADNEQF